MVLRSVVFLFGVVRCCRGAEDVAVQETKERGPVLSILVHVAICLINHVQLGVHVVGKVKNECFGGLGANRRAKVVFAVMTCNQVPEVKLQSLVESFAAFEERFKFILTDLDVS